jgi:hypothetical protein
MSFDINIWADNYIFFLQSVAFSYPSKPNETIKKKYYDLYKNFPLFIPNQKYFKQFINIIEKTPVAPYLDTQLTLLKWTHQIINDINLLLLKEEIDFDTFMNSYYDKYKDELLTKKETFRTNEKIIFASTITLGIILILFFYNK